MTRIVQILLASVAVLLLVAFVALVVVSGTYYGHERVRRMALDALRDVVHGEIMIGRIDGNLLDRFDLVDVTITDKDERPFLVAERVRARVAIAPLLSKRIIITSIELDKPIVTLSKAPAGEWNYKRIFSAEDSLPEGVQLGYGSWVDLHDIVIRDGTLIVHQPYPGDEPVRDSTVLAAMARDSRLRVEHDGNGSLRQTMEFRNINARIPRLIAADPDSVAVAFRVRQMSMMASVFQAPDFDVRRLEGDVRYVADTVTLRDVALRLPDSNIKGQVTYEVSAGEVAMDLKSDTVAFKDLRSLYPALPDHGGGSLDLKATISDTATSHYDVSNADVAVDQSRMTGKLGMSIDSHLLEFHDTDLRFTRLTTQLVERLAPAAHSRIPGSFTGKVRVDGPAGNLRTDISGSFDPDRHPAFQLTARGIVGAGDVLSARNLNLTVRDLPVALARDLGNDVPLNGTVDADALVTGSMASQFTGKATVTYDDDGASSTIIAQGAVVPQDDMRMDVDIDLAPVSLDLIERFASGTNLEGKVTGTGKVVGKMSDLRATLALQLPAGTADVNGKFDLASDTRSYDATVALHNVDARAIAPKSPPTSLNGVATVVGRGIDPATMDSRLTVHITDAMVDSTQVIEAVAVAAARSGVATIDTMRVRTPFATAIATGSFGLAAGRSGTLNYTVDLKNLAGLERWIATGDTSVVPMRPLVRQRAAEKVARGDSLRRAADSTNIGKLASRKDGKRTGERIAEVEVSDALARDSLAGSVSVRGTVKGSVDRFTADGRALVSQIIWGGNEVGRGAVNFTWADVRTPNAKLSAEMGVDSIRAAGFAFDSTHLKATYKSGTGDFLLAVYPGDTAVYSLRALYELKTDEGLVRLQDVNLRFDSTSWKSTRESVVRWKGGGLAVDSLDLRSAEGIGPGRIFVNGELPDIDAGHVTVRIDSLRLAPWLTLLQSNLPADGMASLHADLEGTKAQPRIRGTMTVDRPVYRKMPFPEIQSTFTYDNQRLQFDGSLHHERGGAQLATIKGLLPVDLSLGDSVATRALDGPVEIDLEGDSIPLGPVAEFVEAISVLNGSVNGKIGVRGTWNQPHLTGGVIVNVAKVGVRATNVAYTDGTARLRMDGDKLVVDSLFIRSGTRGWARVTGAVTLAELDHPVLDLKLIANEARVLDNDRGQMVASSRLAVVGPLDSLKVDGSIIVNHGLIRIPDPEQWHLINTGDPVLFSVADTALARELDVAPPSPLLKNADVNVTLKVNRGTWARSSDANVEVYGDLEIARASGDQDVSVKGALFTDYGDYELYGRRFRITRGSVRFTGEPTNPVLQLIAMHEVQQAGRAPFDIQVTIGGTLDRPNISLESQAQPTLTQSDLISFLAFGESSTALLQFEGSGLESSGSSMAGNVATLATRQLAGVALGALFAELEQDLSTKTSADVLNIKPAELPPGLSLSGVRSVALGTQVEYGKYLDRNTFFVGTFRPTLTLPGLMLERRFGTQLRARATVEPRYLPEVPSLTRGLQPKVQQVFGALLFWTRSW